MNIVFIAGGVWQKPFVKYLKNKGHFVAVVNPVATETTLLADYHIRTDINNLSEIDKHIELLNPAFVTSDQSDTSTLTVAKLSEKWNLPGNSVEVIDRLTNKFSIYNFGKLIGVPVPETELVSCSDDIEDFASKHGYPVIIKPTDSTMSRGFHKINCVLDISEEILNHSKKFSKSGQVIVQTFIDGDMITLEGVCSGNKHKTVATSIKDKYFKPGIVSGVRYPSRLPVDFLDEIVSANDRYVEMAGMKFGLTHSEYIINENRNSYCLIEIGGRGGGAGITDKIVPWVSGINVYDVLYDSLIGKIIDVKNLPILQRSALLKYYEIDSVINCDDKAILKIPGVAAFYFDFIGKQYVSDSNDSRHTMGIYLAETDEGINSVVENVNGYLGGKL